MNKKVSTLVAGFLIGGSVFAMAAEGNITFPLDAKALESVKTGDQVVLLQNSNVLGILKDADGVKSASVIAKDAKVEESEVLNYAWKVTVNEAEGSGVPSYTFVNVATGDTLSFRSGTTMILSQKNTSGVMQYAKSGFFKLAFGKYSATPKVTKAIYNGAGQNLFVEGKIDGGTPGNSLVVKLASDKASGVKVSTVTTNSDVNITLHKVNYIDVEDEALNELYNKQGFSFALEDEDVANIFGQKVYAHKTAASGVTIDSKNSLKVPAGTYFFTEMVLKDATAAISDSNIDWLNSTFIVVSSTQTVEVTEADKKAGNGYQFVTKKGSELNMYQGDDERYISTANQIPVCNAAFTVVKSVGAKYPYALKLSTFRYLMPTDSDENNHNEKSIYIGITNHSGADYLTTDASASSYKYIFKKAQSTIVEGLSLLNEDGTPAIYNIQFVSGQGEDSEYNKYLTNGIENGNTDFIWVAEGAVLADLNSPAYQYVITAVDKDNNVTFTNRETGETLKMQLFTEDGCYSVAASGKVSVQPLTIDANTYAVSTGDVVADINTTLVKLNKVTDFDSFNGFLDAENESIITLAYARDNNVTSNKYYTVVEELRSGVYAFKNGDEIVSTEPSDAAQFQLIKSDDAEELVRTYVYNDNGVVAFKANADKVNAYTYALQYIVDGTETGYYLTNNPYTNRWELEPADDNTADKFTVKVNKDGSVSIVDETDFSGKTYVYNFNVKNNGKMSVNLNAATKISFSQGDIYPTMPATGDEVTADNELKLYLLSEAPEISWKAESGHVTLQSELSNYISMNKKREGIVVNESAETFYLHVTDKDAVVPSFYISQGIGENSNGESKRLFLFNPKDSVDYQVNQKWDPDYEWTEGRTKAIFKEGRIVAADTMETIVKGNLVNISKKQNNTDGTLKGIERFKYQIVETPEADGYYYIRQVNGDADAKYLASWNEMLTWSAKNDAMKFHIEDASAPTSNESVSASEVKVIANNGSINVKNAAGKNVVVSTILGQVVANEVLTSDNATINVPAGIVVVAVDGESFKVNVK